MAISDDIPFTFSVHICLLVGCTLTGTSFWETGCLSSTRCGDVVTMMMHSCLLALTKQAYTSSCLEASLTCQRMRKNGKRFVRMCVTLLEDGNLTFPAPLAILSRSTYFPFLSFLIPSSNDDLLLFNHDGQHNHSLMTTACDRACI
ncbi:hypothetical protein V6Z77_006396 [Aspergillus fumigatus]